MEGPHGQYIYYVRQRAGAGLWRMPARGGAEELVSAAVRHGLWTIAAGAIYYFDLERQGPQTPNLPGLVPLRRLDLARGTIATVTTVLCDLPRGIPALTVRSDGGRAVWVSRREHTTEIMLIRNLKLSVQ